jgi:ketosteroid isomerase-like protein
MTKSTSTYRNEDERQLLHIFEVVQPQAVRAHDVPGYASMFADDAIWCPLGAPERHGPAEIAVGVAGVLEGVDIDPVMTPVNVTVHGDAGYLFGHGKLTIKPQDGSPTTVAHSRELWTFSKVHGAWKIYRMIWNADPSPAHKKPV